MSILLQARLDLRRKRICTDRNEHHRDPWRFTTSNELIPRDGWWSDQRLVCPPRRTFMREPMQFLDLEEGFGDGTLADLGQFGNIHPGKLSSTVPCRVCRVVGSGMRPPTVHRR